MIRNVNEKKLAKYVVKENGHWMHKHPLKLFMNPILRKIQFYTDEPYVIASRLSSDLSKFEKFEFMKVKTKNNLKSK
ncbi:hypothetical protein [Vibrio phage phiKT1024]|nr:hypothetical protein [Vibrio phage phiKT1024]